MLFVIMILIPIMIMMTVACMVSMVWVFMDSMVIPVTETSMNRVHHYRSTCTSVVRVIWVLMMVVVIVLIMVMMVVVIMMGFFMEIGISVMHRRMVGK